MSLFKTQSLTSKSRTPTITDDDDYNHSTFETGNFIINSHNSNFIKFNIPELSLRSFENL